MSLQDYESQLSNKPIRQAWDLIHQAWVPANPKVIAKVQAGISSGRYKKQRRALTLDLKSDISLFTFCIRRLSEALKKEKEASALNIAHEPLELLHNSDLSQIASIVREAKETLTIHSYDQMSELQGLRYQNCMISAATAEALADASQIPEELGFSASIMRQFGLTLIAWNYPRIYARELSKLGDGKSLDKALNKVLGFSPSLLGIALARHWNLRPDIRSALGDRSIEVDRETQESQEIIQAGRRLEKICQIGEALARANDPEHYPNARTDWRIARAEIERRLGPDGLRIVIDRVADTCDEYMANAPVPFQKRVFEQIEHRIYERSGEAQFERNHYIKKCPPEIRSELKTFYSRLDPKNISKEHIRILATSLMPLAGFQRGCIYVYDPETVVLIPRLAVGMSSLSDFSEVDCSPLTLGETVIESAFHSDKPVVQENAWARGLNISIASAYGYIQRAGVLYLETCPELSESFSGEPLDVFLALNHTLMDCLKIH